MRPFEGSDPDQFRRLLDASPDGFALVRDDQLVWANKQLVRWIGASSADAVGGRGWSGLFSDRGFGLPSGASVVECGLLRPRLDPIAVSVDVIATMPTPLGRDDNDFR